MLTDIKTRIIKKRAPLTFLLILSTLLLVSQNIEKPILSYTYACASDSFNSFEVEIGYNSATFNDNNIFTLELSDENGDFSSSEILKTIANQNTSFKFTVNFQLPQTIHGTGYKLRVKSSSPEKISPESDAFEAYYITSEKLILNNYKDVILCNGASKQLELNYTSASNYQWYKDGVKFYFGGPKLTVTEPGLYYSEIFYGSCFASVFSNIVEVTKLPSVVSKIRGNAIVELCSGNNYVLESETNNQDYVYTWFKDGEKITGLPNYSPTYTITSMDDFGTYRLEIENSNGCVGTSENVVIKEVNSNFSISAVSNTNSIILDGETKTLEIGHDAINASIKWYRNNVEISNSNSNKIEITQSGIYKAKVTSGTSCLSSKESSEFVVNDLNTLSLEVDTDTNYTSCESTNIDLLLKSVEVKDAQNNTYTLSNNQLSYLNFQWFKDGAKLTNGLEKDITIDNFEDNGLYWLEITSGIVKNSSNKIDVKLSLPESAITSSSSSNMICNGNSILLSTTENTSYQYQWYKNNSIITNATSAILETIEPGNYHIRIKAFGCEVISKEIILLDFDESVVTIDSPIDIILSSGGTKIITASGADSYEWLDDNGIVLSTVASIEISSAGNYNLLAKVNNCELLKTVTVSLEGEETVPNVLTLNGDGINDTWVLSNQYSFKEAVEVQIYNANGKLLLKTTNYQNNWPRNDLISKSQLFYYIIKTKDKPIKKGTISVIK
ncbi:hypothetical protein FDT66_08485 [Polaribacter aestuariivivens]|uniref:Ig-like domain-containing protein n=1 Tax=Polaribacter aestuariivivens TaxID=2304626 RepID=A0A5S3N449_9FLAO|nr:gliding motility-associated C-terminal domain-containing protein [Polaribacter aestuariivivens]TMM29897.1 hypothetical protein FDT66_08485 [Polaribacter aestuariivivens]